MRYFHSPSCTCTPNLYKVQKNGRVVKTATVKDRKYYGYLEGVVSIIVNFLLFIIKFGAGYLINSIALIVDSFHSLSDLFTSVVVIFGFRASEKPSDKEHPFGHGRYEDIATLVIAVLLAVVGFEFLITSSQRLIHPQVVRGSYLYVAIVLLTVVVKEGLTQYAFMLARKIHSSSIHADAWHHRSDALAAIPVAFGIFASMYGIYWLDALFGIVVSAIIIYTGYAIAKGAAAFLMGKPPAPELVENIKNLALVEGVTDVYDIFVHDYRSKMVISLTVRVEPMELAEAHTVADRIEKRIGQELGASAVVHVDGFKVDDSMKKEIYWTVKEHPNVVSCHAIDVGGKIHFHILVDRNMSIEKAHELAHHLGEDISLRFNRDVVIHTEPCIKSCEQCSEECEVRGAPS